MTRGPWATVNRPSIGVSDHLEWPFNQGLSLGRRISTAGKSRNGTAMEKATPTTMM